MKSFDGKTSPAFFVLSPSKAVGRKTAPAFAEKLLLRLSPQGRLRAPHFRHPWRSPALPPSMA
ncbi:MAG: hypothetical protein AAB406_01920, partial [Pseudomonadota bacterium]